jgi:hypothetical protein
MNTKINAKDVEWIVNQNGELGVKIEDQFFFLYKGESLEYLEGDDDMLYAPVRKREFGECCISPEFEKYPERFMERSWKVLGPETPERKMLRQTLRGLEATGLGHVPAAIQLRSFLNEQTD